MILLHPNLSKFQLNQEYYLIDIHQIARHRLANAKGVASYIFRLERAKDIQSVAAIFNEIKISLKDEKFDFLREAIKNWFSRAAVESGIIDPETWARFQSGTLCLRKI